MLATIIGIIIVYSYFIYQYYKAYSLRKDLIFEKNRYNVYEYFKIPSLFVLVFIFISIAMLVNSIRNQDNISIVLSTAILGLMAMELIYFRKTMVFFYNKNSCIVENKVINYKMIKEIVVPSRSIVSRGKIITYNGSEYELYYKCCDIVAGLVKQK